MNLNLLMDPIELMLMASQDNFHIRNCKNYDGFIAINYMDLLSLYSYLMKNIKYLYVSIYYVIKLVREI